MSDAKKTPPYEGAICSVPPPDFDAEEPTRTLCLACGGKNIIPGATPAKDSICPWCTLGTMTPAQRTVYRAYRSERERAKMR